MRECLILPCQVSERGLEATLAALQQMNGSFFVFTYSEKLLEGSAYSSTTGQSMGCGGSTIEFDYTDFDIRDVQVRPRLFFWFSFFRPSPLSSPCAAFGPWPCCLLFSSAATLLAFDVALFFEKPRSPLLISRSRPIPRRRFVQRLHPY